MIGEYCLWLSLSAMECMHKMEQTLPLILNYVSSGLMTPVLPVNLICALDRTEYKSVLTEAPKIKPSLTKVTTNKCSSLNSPSLNTRLGYKQYAPDILVTWRQCTIWYFTARCINSAKGFGWCEGRPGKQKSSRWWITSEPRQRIKSQVLDRVYCITEENSQTLSRIHVHIGPPNMSPFEFHQSRIIQGLHDRDTLYMRYIATAGKIKHRIKTHSATLYNTFLFCSVAGGFSLRIYIESERCDRKSELIGRQ